MRTLSLLISTLLLLGAAVMPSSLAAQDNGRGATTTGAAGDTETAKRIQRLEEQIVDLSAQLSAVESLAHNAGASPSGQPQGDSSANSGGDESRLGQLEMEVRALSAQMGDLIQRLQQLEGRQGIISPSQQPGGARNDYADSDRNQAVRPAEEGTGFSVGGDNNGSSNRRGSSYNGSYGSGSNNTGSYRSGSAAPAPAPAPTPAPAASAEPEQKPAKRSGGLFGLFGGSDETEETTAQRPPSSIQPHQQRSDTPTAGASASVATASPAQAKTLFDTAYSDLMQRNYRAATSGFEQFVQSFPTDPLAGSAHFWLGETSFTNGEYRKAADNFLKCATNFPQNEKAPESLLKLGISLKRLNEKDAACSSFAELSRRFPNASALLQRAEVEKRRTGC
jgi:tol-pal system protein YbgF